MSDLIERTRLAAKILRDIGGQSAMAATVEEAAAALEAAQQEGGRVVGSRKIDDVHVIVANAFTPGVEEQLLVRYDHYLTALEAAREDACVALVADIRFACGDNGKRMQPELVEFIRRLAEDAGRYQWLRDDAVHYSTDDGTPHPWVVFGTGSGDCVPHWEHDLDAAIDQARGKGVADEA